MRLRQLVYVSSALRECSADDIVDLMERSLRNNERDGLSGMLLYARGTFMQVLEGEPAAVEATFQRIRLDDRHRGLIVIDDRPCTEREFARWRMGFAYVDAPELQAHPGFADVFRSGFDVGAVVARPGLALTLLRHFARDYRP